MEKNSILSEVDSLLASLTVTEIEKEVESSRKSIAGNDDFKKIGKEHKHQTAEVEKIVNSRSDINSKLGQLSEFLTKNVIKKDRVTLKNTKLLQTEIETITKEKRIEVEKENAEKAMKQIATLDRLRDATMKDREKEVSEFQKKADEEKKKREDLINELQSQLDALTTPLNELAKQELILKKEVEFYTENYAGLDKEAERKEGIRKEELEKREKEMEDTKKIIDEKLADLKQQSESMPQLQEELEQLGVKEEEIKAREDHYIQKRNDFQVILTKTNKLFEDIKQKTEKLVGSIQEIEKENNEIQKKCEQQDYAFVVNLLKVNNFQAEVVKTQGQVQNLQRLKSKLEEEIEKLKSSDNKENQLKEEVKTEEVQGGQIEESQKKEVQVVETQNKEVLNEMPQNEKSNEIQNEINSKAE
eukprot:TRINITY_DN1718_c0_g3_i2.p1 TRINITY_DN1718_c0_g3~~TRINITY_DN1718_c0_g3_i2.p1  ORF type:complete len:416 (+),score=188.11 TRINITY_DN1718_c0_g3_i2:138-1385(+)